MKREIHNAAQSIDRNLKPVCVGKSNCFDPIVPINTLWNDALFVDQQRIPCTEVLPALLHRFIERYSSQDGSWEPLSSAWRDENFLSANRSQKPDLNKIPSITPDHLLIWYASVHLSQEDLSAKDTSPKNSIKVSRNDSALNSLNVEVEGLIIVKYQRVSL